MMDNCSNPECKTAHAELNRLTEEHDSLEKLVASQKKDITELELAKNEVIDKLAIARTEVR